MPVGVPEFTSNSRLTSTADRVPDDAVSTSDSTDGLVLHSTSWQPDDYANEQACDEQHSPAGLVTALSVEQATLLTHRPMSPSVLKQMNVMSGACFLWSGSVAGGRISNMSLEYEAGATFSIASTLFGLYDAWLTLRERSDTLKRYEQCGQLLVAQYVLRQRLSEGLDEHTHPDVHAAIRMAFFNEDILHSALDSVEKAYANPRDLPILKALREPRLAHVDAQARLMDLENLVKESGGVATPVQRNTLNELAGSLRNLSQEIERLESKLDRSFWLNLKGRRHNPLGHLSGNQVSVLRDGIMQPLKAPFDVAGTAANIAAASQVAAEGLGIAMPLLAGTALPFNAITAVLDMQGGTQQQHRVRTAKEGVLQGMAVATSMHRLYDRLASAQERAVGSRIALQLLAARHAQFRQLHRSTHAAKGRRLKGAINAAGLPLTFVGACLFFGGVSAIASIPGAVILGATSVGFIALLGHNVAVNRARKHEARRQQADAWKFVKERGCDAILQRYLDCEEHATPEERKRLDNVYLSIEWLAQTLTAVANEADHPHSGAEQMLLDAGMSAQALAYLRASASALTQEEHLTLAREVVASVFGQKIHDIDEAAPDHTCRAAAVVAPRNVELAMAPATFHWLLKAIKATARKQRHAHNQRFVRVARQFQPHALNSPGRVLDEIFRHVAKGRHGKAEALMRDVVEQLVSRLPTDPSDGQLIWPGGVRGEPGYCLWRLLTKMVKECASAEQALRQLPSLTGSTIQLRRRLEQAGKLAAVLADNVKRTLDEPKAWWSELAIPADFADHFKDESSDSLSDSFVDIDA